MLSPMGSEEINNGHITQDMSKILVRVKDNEDTENESYPCFDNLEFNEYHFLTESSYEDVFQVNARRRLTRDWHNIITEEKDGSVFDKCSVRRKTLLDEFQEESLIDINNLKSYEDDFITGSSYEGQCSKIGMEGHGTYTFPHGVVYEGQFKDGMFHGKGILVYTQGQALNCTFKKGKITQWEFLFAPPSTEEDIGGTQGRKQSTTSDELDKLKTDQDIDIATYCQPPDRRFNRSYSEGMRGAPNENITNRLHTRVIPEGCYDTEDGFFNPKTKWVHHPDDMNQILYMAPEKSKSLKLENEADLTKFVGDIPHVPVYRTESWIKKNCRTASDENVGYRPDLYEYWFSGRESERHKLNMRTREEGGKFITEESRSVGFLKLFEEMSKQNNKM